MEGTPRADRTYYRCLAKTLVPGSPVLRDHPKNVYLPEAAVLEQLNAWLGRLFAPDNVDDTVASLLGSQRDSTGRSEREAANRSLAEAEARLRRLHAAIEAGARPCRPGRTTQ